MENNIPIHQVYKKFPSCIQQEEGMDRSEMFHKVPIPH